MTSSHVGTTALAKDRPTKTDLTITYNHRVGGALLRLKNASPFMIVPDTGLSRTVTATTATQVLGGNRSYVTTGQFVIRSTVTSTFRTNLQSGFTTLAINSPVTRNIAIKPLTAPSVYRRLRRRIGTYLSRNTATLVNNSITTLGTALPARFRKNC